MSTMAVVIQLEDERRIRRKNSSEHTWTVARAACFYSTLLEGGSETPLEDTAEILCIDMDYAEEMIHVALNVGFLTRPSNWRAVRSTPRARRIFEVTVGE
jgi:hypothetical protein